MKKTQTGHYQLVFLWILFLYLPKCHSWSWFSSSAKTDTQAVSSNSLAEFSMDGLNDQKGMKLLENAKTKLVGSNSCWQNAYRHLFDGCSNILAIEEKRSRFAWHLSDCFEKDSGRPPFPFCDSESAMIHCLKKLNDFEHKIYLEFLLETNSICYQLQTHAFKHETERLVNDLKGSAQYAEHKLEIIEEKSDALLLNSKQIDTSLNSIDLRVQAVAQTSQHVDDQLEVVWKNSKAVYEQSREIAASQSELREGQEKMKEKLEEGMTKLHDAYSNLGQEVDNLRNEAIEIEKEVNKVGEAMSLRMKNLQDKTDDIGNKAGISLDKQQQLLDGQTTALKGLQFLTEFQSQALEESRSTLQHLAEYSHKQQEDLLMRQEQLQRVHDHLVENSKSILEAQEVFESKQASMFIALDKLFVLHNAMLLESRLIKAFFVYFTSIFIIYMFTSTKQTYTVRPRLYIGLCATFFIEVAVLRFTESDMEQQAWIINLVRSIFLLLSFIQLLHSIFTYRDYEMLNHQMLLKLVEKVNGMQRNEELAWDMDSDVNWSSWVDTELPEDMDNVEDPDFIVPEEVGESSSTTTSLTRKYNLRRRHKH